MARVGRGAAPLAGLVIALALLLATRGLDQVVPGSQLGPGFWPRLALLGLAAACLARLVGVARRGARAASAKLDDASAAPPISWPKLAAAIALILLYVLAAPVLGFPVVTLGFIAGFMWLCGTRSVAAIAANAVLGTAGLLYLFVKAVYLPLPKGDGPLEAVTLALYRTLRIF